MTRPRQNIDGFVHRRPRQEIGKTQPVASRRPNREALQPQLASNRRIVGQSSGAIARPMIGVSRTEINESLRAIDQPVDNAEKAKKKRDRLRSPRFVKNRRIAKWAIIAVVSVGLLAGGYLAYTALTASNNIFQGNILNIIQSQPLKEDENGRSNFLVLGTTDQDPDHAGGNLTDSMMVISVDQKNKNAYMFSIPRDLYVKYGMACDAGYSGKINSYFSCVSNGTAEEDEMARLEQTRKFVGEIFGLDIQYGVHINSVVLGQAVDAVGGIDVDIQGSNGAPGILDRNFDGQCNYKCYKVKYDNGVHHLNSEQASYLSMARGNTAPTYGLANSNFDREKNQQKIIIALKNKATSTGTLTNLVAVTELIDAVGDNLRSNIETKEIRTLMQLGNDIKSADIKTISLNDGEDAVIGTDSLNGASVVVPVAGTYDYSQIRALLNLKLSNDPVVREGANIVVLNGSGVAGVAQTEADKLTEANFSVAGVDNAPEGTYADVEVYQIGDGMAGTKQRLESTYGVKVKKTVPPITVDEGVNFVIIFGIDRSSN